MGSGTVMTSSGYSVLFFISVLKTITSLPYLIYFRYYSDIMSGRRRVKIKDKLRL